MQLIVGYSDSHIIENYLCFVTTQEIHRFYSRQRYECDTQLADMDDTRNKFDEYNCFRYWAEHIPPSISSPLFQSCEINRRYRLNTIISMSLNSQLFHHLNSNQQLHIFMQWVGPIRRIHSVNIESEDGDMTPFRAMLKFKPGTKTLKISTTGSHEFPLEFGAEVPNANRMKETWAATQKVFDTSPKTTVQGGSTEGGGGSIRYFNIPDDVDTTQLVLWSRDLGKRTVKAKIEVLSGPNSVRQLYDLHCGGSTQPYHCVIPTPGPGWTIRIIAVNYMEFPFHAVVTPYEIAGDNLGYDSGYGQQPLYFEN